MCLFLVIRMFMIFALKFELSIELEWSTPRLEPFSLFFFFKFNMISCIAHYVFNV